MPAGDGTPRTYSIAAETATGKVNGTLLTNEINADPGITTALSYINTSGDDMDIFFAAALGAPEVTALDALVLAHQGTVTVTAFQFWESNPMQTTSSEAWGNAMSQSSAAMSSGIYRLTYNFELRVVPNAAQNSGGVARFVVDGSRKADAYYRGTEWCAFSGWDRKVFAEGDVALLEIDWRRDPVEGGNDAIEIRKMKMGVELMG